MNKSHLVKIPPLTVCVIIIVSLLLFFKAAPILSQFILETPEREMTNIPPDVKKIISQSPTSSANIQKEVTYRVPILIYHYVEYVQYQNDKGRISLNIPPSVLTSQIKTLQSAGYTFITPSDLTDILDNHKTLPQKSIILSFDDGYRDFYTDVLPILKKYHIRVVAYIVPGLLNQKNWLTNQQLHEIADSGLVEIGAHTIHHLYLKGINKKIVEYEVIQSKKDLEKELGIPVNTFAYPYGAFDTTTIDIVKIAGFKTSVSTLPGIEQSDRNRYFLFRIHPGARSGKNLLDFLKQNTFRF